MPAPPIETLDSRATDGAVHHQSDRPRVVIIGAGFGGLNAAKRLESAPVDVTIIDKRNHHLFQPLLYQVATAGLADSDVATPIRLQTRKSKDTKVLLARATGIDLDKQCVEAEGASPVPYDYLIVAAGARTNYRGDQAAEQHGVGLKSLEDALKIRGKVLSAFEAAELQSTAEGRRECLTFVVVGGGPTGVELAGALAELSRHTLRDQFRSFQPGDARVILAEVGPQLLAGYRQSLADAAREQLEDLGVEVRLDARVGDIQEGSICIDGQRVCTSVLCWAAGVEPVPLARMLGEQASDGRVKVEQDCSLPGHPNVFVIGDMAHQAPDGSGEPLPGVAPVAVQQGKYVANVIRKELSKGSGARKPFSYRDKGMMATVGRSRAVVERGRLAMSGTLAWLAWLVVHIFFLVGFRNRISVFINWAYSYLTYQRGHRVIAESVDVDPQDRSQRRAT